MITVNDKPLLKDHYPVGEQNLELSEEILDFLMESVILCRVVPISWRYNSDEEFMTLYFLVNKIKEEFPSLKINLTINYLPYARMDKASSVNKFFTLKYVMKFLDSLDVESITAFDIHSDVAVELSNKLKNKASLQTLLFAEFLVLPDPDVDPDENNLVLCFPDYPTYERFKDCTLLINKYVILEKELDTNTGKVLSQKIHSTNCDSFEGKTVIMIDDICSYGETFIDTMDVLTEAYTGIKEFRLVVTHLEKSFYFGPLPKDNRFKAVYHSNTLDYDKSDLQLEEE